MRQGHIISVGATLSVALVRARLARRALQLSRNVLWRCQVAPGTAARRWSEEHACSRVTAGEHWTGVTCAVLTEINF